LWQPELVGRRIEAAPLAPGFLLVLPRPEGVADGHADQLAEAGVAALVSLLPREEALALGLDPQALARACARRGIRFALAPIEDFGLPDRAFEQRWRRLGGELRGLIRESRGVALHCRAGLGRSGTIAARLLIELGLDPEAAIARVRAARPGAIETAAQEDHVRWLARSRPEG
jgi:ADP-ribosyl-[dinitrogen reductase] hydrolase